MSRSRNQRYFQRFERCIDEDKSNKSKLLKVANIHGLTYELESLKKNQEVIQDMYDDIMQKLEHEKGCECQQKFT